MSKLTVSGAVVEGVRKASVHIVHSNPKAPDTIPLLEWNITLRLQHDDMLSKWAMAPQGPERFKKCELIIYQSNKQVAHTWTLLNAYIHEYDEIEHPDSALTDSSGEGGYLLNLVIRGLMLEGKDYTGDNVMTVGKGEARSLPT